MKTRNIPENILEAAASLLKPYAPHLTPETLARTLHADADPTADLPRMVDKHAAARALGVSWFTVVNMLKAKELRGTKIRGVWRIPVSEIERIAGGGADE